MARTVWFMWSLRSDPAAMSPAISAHALLQGTAGPVSNLRPTRGSHHIDRLSLGNGRQGNPIRPIRGN